MLAASLSWINRWSTFCVGEITSHLSLLHSTTVFARRNHYLRALLQWNTTFSTLPGSWTAHCFRLPIATPWDLINERNTGCQVFEEDRTKHTLLNWLMDKRLFFIYFFFFFVLHAFQKFLMSNGCLRTYAFFSWLSFDVVLLDIPTCTRRGSFTSNFVRWTTRT